MYQLGWRFVNSVFPRSPSHIGRGIKTTCRASLHGERPNPESSESSLFPPSKSCLTTVQEVFFSCGLGAAQAMGGTSAWGCSKCAARLPVKGTARSYTVKL